MNSYYSARVWSKADTHIPGTLSAGGTIDEETVQNMPVVEVIDGSYRSVHIPHGYFVISPFEIPSQFSTAKKIVVLFRWFDRRLRATGLRLRVDSANVTFHPNYSGPVVTNIRP